MSFQQMTILGRLGRDPETKAAKSGVDICKFSVASSEKRGGEEKTLWLNAVCFGKTAELAQEYLAKGRQVLLVGRLEVEEYESKGEKRTSVNIIVDRLTFVSDGSGKGGGRPEKTSRTVAVDDDSIPF
jgi:single-strand DNA-binding protein